MVTRRARSSGQSRKGIPRREYQPVLDRIAVHVRLARERLALTQESASEACGMDLRVYQAIESARTNATVATLVRVASGLGVEVAALLMPAPPRTRRGPGRPSRSESA